MRWTQEKAQDVIEEIEFQLSSLRAKVEGPPRRLAYRYDAAAQMLGVPSAKTIQNLVNAGKLQAVRVGAYSVIPHAELERFIASQVAELRDTA